MSGKTTEMALSIGSKFDTHHDATLVVGTICYSASVTPKLARGDKPGRKPRSSAETRSLRSREREPPPIGRAIPGFFGAFR